MKKVQYYLGYALHCLNLFTQTCNGYVQHLAIFGHRAACYAVTLGVEDVHQRLIRKGMALVLLIDTLLQYVLNLVARHRIATLGGQDLRCMRCAVRYRDGCKTDFKFTAAIRALLLL